MKTIRRKLFSSILLLSIFICSLYVPSIDSYAANYKSDYFPAEYSSGWIADIAPTSVVGAYCAKASDINSALASHDWKDTVLYYNNNTAFSDSVYLEYKDAVSYIDANGNQKKLTLRIHPMSWSSSTHWAMGSWNLSVWNLYHSEQYTALQYRFYDVSATGVYTEVGYNGILCLKDLDTHEAFGIINESVVTGYYRVSSEYTTVKKTANVSEHKNNANNPIAKSSLKWYVTKGGTDITTLTYYFGDVSSGSVTATDNNTAAERQAVWMTVSTTANNRFTLGYASYDGRRAANLSYSGVAVNYYVNNGYKTTRYFAPYSYIRTLSKDDPSLKITGYTVRGWYAQPELTSAATSVAGTDINVFGAYDANQYQMTVDPNGGKMKSWVDYSEAGALTKPFYYNTDTDFCIYTVSDLWRHAQCFTGNRAVSTPYRDKHQFRGWQCDSVGSSITWDHKYNEAGTIAFYRFKLSGAHAGNVTIKAIWSRICSIKLDNQSATTSGSTYYYELYGDGNYSTYYKRSTTSPVIHSDYVSNKITKITVPTKTGYIFGGYYTGTNGSGTQYVDANGNIVSTALTFTNDATLYAKWTPIQYKIVYNKGLTNN